ncbi:DHA2 family efflux MFS transporter permease subunit [Kribbella sandramycini]|uniref:DHA2 family efflux MFS transporter permease subunit n=1 Tax=Kribbella sandramycini TaxID=60450 RepID=A0A7Y4L2G6_9ACTN|nr:DHA2 family efflux MFS transporter permease subunit [Kribbella sandramycini]MBB6566195.1 EmrB/QacA subfamily drug resistance transporter [Kribbella sandramycini]NOL43138.1 DHA2 family efflux MFS transporter permease subunit [Kribbella sandramycini]
MAEDRIAFGTARARWVLAATALGSGMAFLDGTVVNVALPAMGEELGAGMAGLQWIVNGYMLMLASLILLSGSLGDRLGRRRMYVTGVIWFAVASVICTIAPTLEVMIAGRVLQGIGGALLTPGSLAILQTTFAPADRGKAVGAWSGLTSVAAAIGPFVGGTLVDSGSWRLIFLINAPIALVTVLVTLRHVPETRDETSAGKVDVSGAALATIGLGGFTFGLIQAGDRGFTDAGVLTSLVIGVLAFVFFLVVERRSSHPMLPPGIFANRRFTGANLVTVVVYGGLGTATFLVVVFLQTALGYAALWAGAALLPMTALMLGLSGYAGGLAEKIGARIPMTVGPVLIALGFLLMLRISPGVSYVTAVLPAVVVLGLGLVSTVAPLTATVLSSVEDHHAGIASGVNNAIARSAQLMAVAAIPMAAGITGAMYRDPIAFSNGFHRALIISAALAATGSVIAWVTLGDGARRRPVQVEHHRHCALEAPPYTDATP